MKLYTLLLTSALTLGLAAPAAFADAPEGMVVAQAKTKKRIKRRATKKVTKKATPLKEMAGEIQVERGKKGALKSVHLVTADGARVPVMLNPKARKMAKLGGKMTVKGKMITRKGISWMRLVSFSAVPEPKPEPEIEEIEQPVAPVVPVKPVEPVRAAPPVDTAPVDDAPVGDDDAPMDDDRPGVNDDDNLEDRTNDDAPLDDDAPSGDDMPSDDDAPSDDDN